MTSHWGTCEDSDQTARMHRLIWVVDCVDAQADLSLRWALIRYCGKCCALAYLSMSEYCFVWNYKLTAVRKREIYYICKTRWYKWRGKQTAETLAKVHKPLGFKKALILTAGPVKYQMLTRLNIWGTEQGRIQDDFWGSSIWSNFRTYSMYSDRHAWTNSADSDQTPQNKASDQCLHCLPLTQ